MQREQTLVKTGQDLQSRKSRINFNSFIMTTISELKNKALAQLHGNWKKPVIVALVYYLIVAVFYGIQAIPVIGNIIYFAGSLLFVPVLAAGLMIVFLCFFRGERENLIDRLFSPFNEYGRYLGTMLLVALYTVLWSLLLLIPGVIKSLSYSLTAYILKDNPELQNNAAIELSMKMMDGYKWKLFLLQLSFIGWILLCLLTLGIGLLWLIPYYGTTMSAFYEDVKADYATKQATSM
jgi:uncharacterized membrane protein